jgi:hypothetical protein
LLADPAGVGFQRSTDGACLTDPGLMRQCDCNVPVVSNKSYPVQCFKLLAMRLGMANSQRIVSACEAPFSTICCFSMREFLTGSRLKRQDSEGDWPHDPEEARAEIVPK